MSAPNPTECKLFVYDPTGGNNEDLQQLLKDFESVIVGVEYERDESTNEPTGSIIIEFLTPKDVTVAHEQLHGGPNCLINPS
ncbi:hypothetical protein FB45DRAFT_1060828 [Roridomyces roridus]|uniref:RRM domain-containing protein n=1 Tax=Roridomyces roridus TaxID=1738132 RepID=A0AAD7BLY4_9AGAR|nr:hypothetical protein FB45DRAFT_1060828 [Roridomyces roridus]